MNTAQETVADKEKTKTGFGTKFLHFLMYGGFLLVILVVLIIIILLDLYVF